MSTRYPITPAVPERPRWLLPFGIFAVLFLIASQATALLLSAPDRDMGNLQKILYVHVPSAWMSMIAPAVVFVASVLYLWKRQAKHDMVAAAAAQVGIVFIGLTLIQGSIWARPTWGIWWTWDPRLTTTAILFLIYAGYLALRAFAEDEDQRGRWSAAVGILGFLNVPIVYMSVRWWRTIHQVQSTPDTMDATYKLGLRLNAFAFLFIFIFLVGMRYYIARLERARAAVLEERALTGGTVHV
ncbi:MAG TPA: cytochrome c biogenesis protein CcsA [Longimicrobiales bacterium]|nr:cytochrome c biogenesis protein CcsA [Longimicrobiales bacterium]